MDDLVGGRRGAAPGDKPAAITPSHI